MTDLFETPELIPTNVVEVLNTFNDEGCSYKELDRLLAELKPLGYIFDYGLDAEPYELQKI
jgi:hypothetical protein